MLDIKSLSGTAKALLRKSVTLNAHIRKKRKSQISNLSSHFKNREKEKQKKPIANRRKKIMTIKAALNEMQNRKIGKLNEIAAYLKTSKWTNL